MQLFQGFGVGRIMKGILLRFSVEKWQSNTWKIGFAFRPVCLVEAISFFFCFNETVKLRSDVPGKF